MPIDSAEVGARNGGHASSLLKSSGIPAEPVKLKTNSRTIELALPITLPHGVVFTADAARRTAGEHSEPRASIPL